MHLSLILITVCREIYNLIISGQIFFFYHRKITPFGQIQDGVIVWTSRCTRSKNNINNRSWLAYPDTRPIPVMMPPAATSSSPYSLYPANWLSSKKGDLKLTSDIYSKSLSITVLLCWKFIDVPAEIFYTLVNNYRALL